MVLDTLDHEATAAVTEGEFAKREFFNTLNFADPKQLMHLYRPMSFNKRKRGNFEIVDQVLRKVPVVNFRNAYLLGVRPVELMFQQPTTFHKLMKRGKVSGTLTTDTPNETYTQYLSFHHMRGNVLVGGLGLGLAATIILDMPGVTGVTVVERETALINLIKPQIDPRIKIVNGDLFEYLRSDSRRRSHDSAYYDIWYYTREETWATTLVPLYRLSRRAGINVLGGWCEFDMWGQLYPALYSRALLLGKFPPSRFKPHKVFLEAIKKEGIEELKGMVELYLTQVGTETWERTFAWEGK